MSASAPMREAIELALRAVAAGGGPFGAVVVRSGAIVGRGANRVVASADPTAHAEIVAIREACRALGTHELSGCEIFASTEPCPMCLGAIQWARIERVHYACTRADAAEAGFDDLLFHDELGRALPDRRIPMLAEGRAEALAAFLAWRAKPDRNPY
jgi:tRNA(Arg) A34 adenosine deaminase TadA